MKVLFRIVAMILLGCTFCLTTNLLAFSLVLEGMMRAKAPSFVLEDTTDSVRSLSDYQGKKVLLFFFGKNNEYDFKDVGLRYSYNNEHLVLLDRLNPWFSKNNISVLGISDYTKEKLKALAARDNVTLTLLSDARSRLIAYLYGTAHSLVGIERSIFLINEEGNISYALQSADPQELVVSSVIEILKNSEPEEIVIKSLSNKVKDNKESIAIEKQSIQALVGSKASDFLLKDYKGSEHSLSEHHVEKVLLCFFKRNVENEVGNPCAIFADLINTRECLNELKSWLVKQKIELVTVLNYLPEDITCLKRHFDDQSILLYDSKEEVLSKYGISMENKFWPLKQAILLLDEQGVVRVATDVRSPFEQLYHILSYLLQQEKMHEVNDVQEKEDL